MKKKQPKSTPPDHIIKVAYDPKKKLAVASTDTVDRHGEIINQDGWDLANFKSNPVLLWAHDHTEPAVGAAEDIQLSLVNGKKALTFTPVFHGKTELSAAMDALYNGDAQASMKPVLNSFSVGFLPLDQEDNVFTKNELLEISCVNVPANADARVLAYKGLVGKGITDRIAKKAMNFKGAVQDELDLEAVWAQKCENMEDVRDIYWAFCDVYFDESTPATDFKTLLLEVATLFTSVANGTFTNPIPDEDDDDVVEESANKVLDRLSVKPKDKRKTAKEKQPSAPVAPSQILRNRQSLTKVIVKASDQLLADKSKSLTDDESVKLVKVIKRAGEILSKSHKGEMNHG